MDSSPEQNVDDEAVETHCVIEVASKCTDELVEWLISRIQAPTSSGGAEFLVRAVRHVDTNKFTCLHVFAPMYRLMVIAEWLEVMKPDFRDNGRMKEFTVSSRARFLQGGDESQLFTYAEKARFVNFEINELRAKSDEVDRFFSTNKLRFSQDQTLITKVQRKDLITRIFSLHDKDDLKRLSTVWVKAGLFKKQPLDEIRAYFGEHLALYFAFLGFYTEMLIPATVLGITMFLVQFFSEASLSTTAAFAVFNVLWATFFLERWKRYCNRLCYKWGVLYKTNATLELPRAQFKGEMGRNPVTGYPEPVYPDLARNLWIGLVSTPVVVSCLFLTIFILGTYLEAQAKLSAQYLATPTIILFVQKLAPSAVYSICINVFRTVYRYVASWLTEKENHRLQSSYEFHLIWKLLLFNFVNSFASLFYICFWLLDLELLRSHLAALLITNQIIDQFPETIVPFLKMKYEKWRTGRIIKKEERKRTDRGENEDPNFSVLREQARIQAELPEYMGTFDDYLELFLQFGYTFLFSSAFPIASHFALINNIVEIRGDGFKLCKVMQRPFALSANSIGPWQLAFELMGFAAVTTNLAIIYVTPTVKDYFGGMDKVDLLLAFVVIEHLLVFAKLGMTVVLPSVPREVQLDIARSEYEMKQALKARRAEESRKSFGDRKSFGIKGAQWSKEDSA